MSDFETSATVDLVVPDRALRQVRDDVEEIGPVSVGVELEDGRATTAGTTMATDGGRAGQLASLAEDRNDYLEDLVDAVERGGSGGLGVGGGGGGGGGGGPLDAFGIGPRNRGGGFGRTIASALASAGIVGVGGGINSGLRGVLNDQFGTDFDTGFVDANIPDPAEDVFSSFAEDFTPGETFASFADFVSTPPDRPDTIVDNFDDYLPASARPDGSSDSGGDPVLGILDLLEGPTPTNTDGGPATTGGREVSRAERAILNQTDPAVSAVQTSGGTTISREDRAILNQTGTTTNTGTSEDIEIAPNVTLNVSALSDLQRELDRGLDQVRQEVLNDLRRQLGGSASSALQDLFQQGF